MTIKRGLITGTAGLLLFAAGYTFRSFGTGRLDLLPNVQAQEPGRKCSLKTLKGAYGIKFEGQRIGQGPLTSVSRVVFDGNGVFTTSEIGTLFGDPLTRTFTGPYVVNDDCTGFLDFTSHITNPPHEAHGDFVIVSNGQEFFIVDSEEHWAANGVGKRIN
jgi:hypothetical protein